MMIYEGTSILNVCILVVNVDNGIDCIGLGTEEIYLTYDQFYYEID